MWKAQLDKITFSHLKIDLQTILRFILSSRAECFEMFILPSPNMYTIMYVCMHAIDTGPYNYTAKLRVQLLYYLGCSHFQSRCRAAVSWILLIIVRMTSHLYQRAATTKEHA